MAEQKLTAAEIRALVAVTGGKVVRIYRSSGNILRGPKGVGASVLWKLDSKNFIADGSAAWGEMERTCRQVLTPAGRAALDAQSAHSPSLGDRDRG